MDYSTASLKEISENLAKDLESKKVIIDALFKRLEKEGDVMNNVSKDDVAELLNSIKELDRVEGMGKDELRKAQAAYARK